MMRHPSLIACAAAGMLWSGSLEAACALTATTGQPNVLTTYDPFSPAQTVLDISVQVMNRGADPCEAKLYLRPASGAQALEGASARLDFRLDGQLGPGAGRAGELGPFVAQVPARQSAIISVRASLRPQQVVPRGVYTADMLLRLEDQEAEPVALAGGTVRLQAEGLARTEMSISGTSSASVSARGLAPASIDFGKARSGQTERVFINVWSNGLVAVTLDSENDGVLRLLQNPALPPIAYSASFDGSPISLAAPITLVRSPPMSLSGASYELALTLADLSANYAGRYQDVITVSVNQN